MSTRNYARYEKASIHTVTRTITLADPAVAPEYARIVDVNGAYPDANAQLYGVTIQDREVGVSPFLAAPTVPAIAARAYAVGERFTLTAPQAANVAGGLAGIYQVHTAFTAAATTLTAPEGLNIFYVGTALQPNVRTQHGQTSTTPLFPLFDTSNYQRNIPVCTLGTVVIETGGAITKGAGVNSDTSGRAVSTGSRFIGIALEAATAAGQFIRVEIK